MQTQNSRSRDSGTGLSIGTGGQASATGSGPFMTSHAVGVSWEVPKREPGRKPQCHLDFSWGLFANPGSLCAAGQPLQRALQGCDGVPRFKRSEEGSHTLPYSFVAHVRCHSRRALWACQCPSP